ncbi:MAG TPA: hypothetical protein VKT33_04080 [Candidatus Angelobacter sp.]|nr:hypothetical protein [Candidatus Angelobacter sp.]
MKLRIAAILFAGFISTYSQTSSHQALAVQAPTEQQENSIASIAPGESKINPEKEADIRRLLDITGTKKLVE